MRAITIVASLFASTIVMSSAAARAFEVPALTGYVNDQAAVLSVDARVRLEERLGEFQSKNGPQFVLLTVESLGGLTVEEFSLKTADAWALGSAEHDDGLLMVIAKRERKVRIEVGRGLEGAIPDAIASRIIREILAPALKRGTFDQGIERAFNALIVRASGPQRPEPSAAPSRHQSGSETPHKDIAAKMLPLLILFVLFYPMLVIRLAFRNMKWVSVPAGSHSHYSSASTSSSSSSSFSGGGGSFGGGGASGSW